MPARPRPGFRRPGPRRRVVSVTVDIVAFIRARLDEDEHFANQEDADYGATTLLPTFDSEHQHRWNTDRVRCGVEVKRRLLDLHATIDVYDWNPSGHCRECSDSGWEGAVDGADSVQQPCPTLRAVASEWSTHSDYQPEWTQ